MLGVEPGGAVDVRLMRAGSTVADGARIYLVAGRFVMNLAPAAFPGVSIDEAEAMTRARAHLGAFGDVILPVVASGTVGDCSYYLVPLAVTSSDRRLMRAFQRWRMRARIFEWLRGLASLAAPASESAATDFADCLRSLCAFPGLSDALRQVCEAGVERIRSGDFKPRHCPMHGDMWLGNVLRSTTGDLVIIDWGGSKMDGYPLFDLVRYAESANLSPAKWGKELHSHLALLGLEPRDARILLLAAFGHFSRDLGEFPPARFLDKVRECDRHLSKVLRG